LVEGYSDDMGMHACIEVRVVMEEQRSIVYTSVQL
jgi:hypothetical protein